MTNQLRYNQGKPKLTYILANERAFNDFTNNNRGWPLYSDTTLGAGYIGAVNSVREYLAGGPRSLLVEATRMTIAALQAEVGTMKFVTGRSNLAAFYEAFAEVCRVYHMGELKYERGNFRKGGNITGYLDSFARHYTLIQRGETFDADSNRWAEQIGGPTRHGAHMFWNIWQALDQPDSRDDRLPPVQGGKYDRSNPYNIAFDLETADFKDLEFKVLANVVWSAAPGLSDWLPEPEVEFDIVTDPALAPETYGCRVIETEDLVLPPTGEILETRKFDGDTYEEMIEVNIDSYDPFGRKEEFNALAPGGCYRPSGVGGFELTRKDGERLIEVDLQVIERSVGVEDWFAGASGADMRTGPMVDWNGNLRWRCNCEWCRA